jgi:hypothetical protein
VRVAVRRSYARQQAQHQSQSKPQSQPFSQQDNCKQVQSQQWPQVAIAIAVAFWQRHEAAHGGQSPEQQPL